MKIVCVEVLVELVCEDVLDEVVMVYGKKLNFGCDYIILMLFDFCLIYCILLVVVKVGMEIGVVCCLIVDMDVYESLFKVWMDLIVSILCSLNVCVCLV